MSSPTCGVPELELVEPPEPELLAEANDCRLRRARLLGELADRQEDDGLGVCQDDLGNPPISRGQRRKERSQSGEDRA